MVCTRPIKGYRDASGVVKFAAGIGGDVAVACGQCADCRLERSRQWAVRIMHEAQENDRNSFLTLTYDQKNLPPGGSLQIKDWQKFAKRLRKNVGPFRYYHCGEYGEETGRPHYHACIFGMDFRSDAKAWDKKLWTSETLDTNWQKGRCLIGQLTFESAAYVARYIMKKQTGTKADLAYTWVNTDTGEEIKAQPEYATMSRGGKGGKGGIGAAWFKKYGGETYREDSVIINGRETRPPTYYDTLFGKEDPDGLEALKIQRMANAEKHSHNNTPQRLEARHTYTVEKLAKLKRDKI